MTFLRPIPGFLALLILAAHFLRAGNLIFLLLVLALLVLIFIRKPWCIRTVQIGLVLGSLEWVWTLWMLILERRMAGLPYLRLSLILGAVALFTALGALSLQTKRSSAA